MDSKGRLFAWGLMAVTVAGALAGCQSPGENDGSPITPETQAVNQDSRPSLLMPPFRDIASWINSKPLKVEELRGRVVLVDFWTYTCINCIRTLPYLKDWQAKYSSRGLVILGVHSPEFAFEKDLDNVQQAVQDLGITWPVALDNEFSTWKAYNNRYWPHKYLIDAEGRLRYHHIGEGAYGETEEQIRQALKDAGYDISDIALGNVSPPVNHFEPVTREIYTGHFRRLGDYLGNPAPGTPLGQSDFVDPGKRKDGKFFLHGQWEVSSEAVRLAELNGGDAPYIAIWYMARSVNAVIHSRNRSAMRVQVLLDQTPVSPELSGDDIVYDADGQSYLNVKDSRMYSIIRGPNVGSRELRLLPSSVEFQLYAYTFSR